MLKNTFLFNFILSSFSSNVIVDINTRKEYISNSLSWYSEYENDISKRDLYNGPNNPYNIKTWDTIDCNFIEPDLNNLQGGTTPKFRCNYEVDGKMKEIKIKYDQQYNSVLERWGRPNEEVYASVVSQRILWALGFGADQSVPVTVNCHNCPIEPWTYIQAVQGYTTEDVLSGWMNMKLIETNTWNQTLSLVTFSSAIVYFKLDDYIDADDIVYIDSEGNEQEGFGWHEMYENKPTLLQEKINRDALSVLAAFISHCDNFDGNQGFLCVDTDSNKLNHQNNNHNDNNDNNNKLKKDKTSCKGQPFLYIHDVGGTLGYGWNLKHHNAWPNYFDLTQWSELNTWGDLSTCQVHVNGLPGCSWTGNLKVSDEGLQMAARLLKQLTDQQIIDLFTAARANLMRNDSINDWIAGFHSKMERDIFNVSC